MMPNKLMNRDEQLIQLRLEYEMRMNENRLDHDRRLQSIVIALNNLIDTHSRRPMTRQGKAIRNYIAQYKAQHNANSET